MKEPKSHKFAKYDTIDETVVFLASISKIAKDAKKDPDHVRSTYFIATMSILSVIFTKLSLIEVSINKLEGKA